MKIGVITLSMSNLSYGQLLQMYSLQVYLKKLGHESFLIRYNDRNEISHEKQHLFKRIYKILLNPIEIRNHFKRKRAKVLGIKLAAENPAHFDLFHEKYINSTRLYNTYEELKSSPPKADVYITGSDIVWNCSYNPNVFFLNFGDDNIIRLSYAPSFGSKMFPEDKSQIIASLLKRFKAISVREESGITICKSLGYKAKLVPDPTMLLKKEDYLKLINNSKGDNVKSIFLFLLGTVTKVSMTEIYNFANAEKYNVDYVAIQGRFDKYPKTYPTPNKWLEMLNNSEYVMTNSFHGCVMAMIFNKKFLFFPLNGNSKQLNDRINSLLARYKLSNRIYKNDISVVKEDINYSLINSDIEERRKEVMYWFSKILSK